MNWTGSPFRPYASSKMLHLAMLQTASKEFRALPRSFTFRRRNLYCAQRDCKGGAGKPSFSRVACRLLCGGKLLGSPDLMKTAESLTALNPPHQQNLVSHWLQQLDRQCCLQGRICSISGSRVLLSARGEFRSFWDKTICSEN